MPDRAQTETNADVSTTDGAPQRVRSGAAPAVVDLTGDLPCVGCGYNLKGLSISGACSECGTPVRATILARVDPMAEQLQPLRRPRPTAWGLMVWSGGAVLAAAMIWAIRILGLSEELLSLTPSSLRNDLSGAFRLASLVGLVLSMVGALVLIRPTAGLRPWECFKAAGAVVAYLPLVYIHHRIHNQFDVQIGPPFVGPELLSVNRSYLHLAEAALVIAIILGLRGNAVALAERSLVMRLGRVDTQPLIALVWCMLLAAAGDVIVIAMGSQTGSVSGLIETVALVAIAVGSFLFTVGLVGVFVDTVRLRPILLEPAPGLTDIFSEEDRRTGRSSE